MLFNVYLYFDVVKNKILLTDDLARLMEVPSESEGYSSYVYRFLNTLTMSSRPVSGYFYGTSLYFTRLLGEDFYYINYLYFIIAVLLVYVIANKIFRCKGVAYFAALMYSFVPIGTSVAFSPIMMNSALATIFYCLSLLCVFSYKENKKWYVLSIIFFILSVLSYEIFIPLVLLNAYFISDRRICIKLLYIGFVLGGIFIYRELLEQELFSNYYHRDSKQNILNIRRNYFIIKSILIDFPYNILLSFYRSIIAMKYYNVSDWLMLASFGGINIIFIHLFDRIDIRLNKKNFYWCLCGLILSFVIFFVSNYEPNVYGFDNRNLGSVRFYFVLFLVFIFIALFRKSLRILKISLFFTSILFFISAISVKNAWKYANEFNKNVFIGLKKKLPIKPLTYNVLIVFNTNKEEWKDRNMEYLDRHYILKEPVFKDWWESSNLKRQAKIDDKYNVFYYYDNGKKIKEKGNYYLYNHKENTLVYYPKK